MSKRKGLSFEEKRTRLLEIFHESKDFYQLKELEKLGPKLKGIVSQSVKEVLDSLVADNIVTAEKIGTSNYFWAFPSTAGHQRRKRLDDLRAELEQLQSQSNELAEKVDAANEGREESNDRKELLEQLQQAEHLRAKLDQELKKYADNDPAVIEAMRKDVKLCMMAANRWTENIMSIQYYCNSHFGISNEDFNRQFGIPDDFDTIELR